jgi:hypothetical protein
MIKVGSLVKLNPKFYSITYGANPLKDYIGLVIEVEKDFYKNTISLTNIYTSQNRYKILFGDTIGYEPESAIIEIIDEYEDR